MGLSRLRLVSPKTFPAAEASERAAGADDLLHAAEVHDSLASALIDSAWAVATSARTRHLGWPALTPEACAGQLVARAREETVALVFGRERSGLTNEEMDMCQASVMIPTAPDFHSLNLASAVQVFAYLLRREAVTDNDELPGGDVPPRAQFSSSASRTRRRLLAFISRAMRRHVDGVE